MATRDEGIKIVSSISSAMPDRQGFISVKFRDLKKTADDRKRREEDDNGETFEKEEHIVDVTA